MLGARSVSLRVQSRHTACRRIRGTTGIVATMESEKQGMGFDDPPRIEWKTCHVNPSSSRSCYERSSGHSRSLIRVRICPIDRPEKRCSSPVHWTPRDIMCSWTWAGGEAVACSIAPVAKAATNASPSGFRPRRFVEADRSAASGGEIVTSRSTLPAQALPRKNGGCTQATSTAATTES